VNFCSQTNEFLIYEHFKLKGTTKSHRKTFLFPIQFLAAHATSSSLLLVWE
jgi:hypothetical protein